MSTLVIVTLHLFMILVKAVITMVILLVILFTEDAQSTSAETECLKEAKSAIWEAPMVSQILAAQKAVLLLQKAKFAVLLLEEHHQNI
jgi:hypothetical protein